MIDLGGAVGAPANVSVPLQIVGGTEPVAHISVNGGKSVPVLVDTGSTGLVIPLQDIGIKSLGFPTGIGLGGYSGGIDYIFLTFNAPVNFGNGVVSAPTAINVPIISWPVSIQAALTNGWTFSSYFANDGVVGVLGVGANAGGPSYSTPTTALAGGLSNGVLINEPANTLTFGPAPTGLTELGSVSGSPIGNLLISTDGGVHTTSITSFVDSGGVYGTIPSNVGWQQGDTITVYDSAHNKLYSYTPTADIAPTVIPAGETANTGYYPFSQMPIYTDYTVYGGQTIFYQ